MTGKNGGNTQLCLNSLIHPLIACLRAVLGVTFNHCDLNGSLSFEFYPVLVVFRFVIVLNYYIITILLLVFFC